MHLNSSIPKPVLSKCIVCWFILLLFSRPTQHAVCRLVLNRFEYSSVNLHQTAFVAELATI